MARTKRIRIHHSKRTPPPDINNIENSDGEEEWVSTKLNRLKRKVLTDDEVEEAEEDEVSREQADLLLLLEEKEQEDEEKELLVLLKEADKKDEEDLLLPVEEEGDEEEGDNEDSEEEEEYDEKSESVKKILSIIKDPELIQLFHNIMTNIEESKVTPLTILKTPLLMEDRVELMEHFEALAGDDCPSFQYLAHEKELKKMFSNAKRKYIEYSRLPPEITSSFNETKDRLLNMSSALPLEYNIINLEADDHIKSVLFREANKLNSMSYGDEERVKLERWIETCLTVPFRRYKQLPDNRSVFLKRMKDILDSELYGMESIKEQLMMFANARLSNPRLKECVLGLVGPPGIGKTVISRLLSTCLDVPFAQISCGGINDADVLKGSNYTYIGSRPGNIATSLIDMKYNNGVLYMDEFEKVSAKPEIISLLLHVLDPQQNSAFQDNYLGRDIKINLSGVWFILSMNDLPLDSALQDRIYTIHMQGYNTKEKVQIALKHLIPKILKNLNMDVSDVTATPKTIEYLISLVSKDCKGVRSLNNALKEIITKIHFLHQTDFEVSFRGIKPIKLPYSITEDDIDKIICKSSLYENTSAKFMYT